MMYKVFLVFFYTANFTFASGDFPEFVESRTSANGVVSFFYFNEKLALVKHLDFGASSETSKYHYSFVEARFLNKPDFVNSTGDVIEKELINTVLSIGIVSSNNNKFLLLYGNKSLHDISEKSQKLNINKYTYLLLDKNGELRDFEVLADMILFLKREGHQLDDVKLYPPYAYVN